MVQSDVCCHFLEGRCRFGRSCRWRHAVGESESIMCRHGTRCRFGHGFKRSEGTRCSISQAPPRRPPLRARPAPQESSIDGRSSNTSSDSNDAFELESENSSDVFASGSNDNDHRSVSSGCATNTQSDNTLTSDTVSAPEVAEITDATWKCSNALGEEPWSWYRSARWASSAQRGWSSRRSGGWKEGSGWQREEKPVCCRYLEGSCMRGNSCWWSHPVGDAGGSQKRRGAGRHTTPLPEATRCNFGGRCYFGHGRRAWMRAGSPDDEEQRSEEEQLSEERISTTLARSDSDKENQGVIEDMADITVTSSKGISDSPDGLVQREGFESDGDSIIFECINKVLDAANTPSKTCEPKCKFDNACTQSEGNEEGVKSPEKSVGTESPSRNVKGPERIATLAIKAILTKSNQSKQDGESGMKLSSHVAGAEHAFARHETEAEKQPKEPPSSGGSGGDPQYVKSLTLWDCPNEAEKALRMLRGDWSSIDLQGSAWLHKVSLEAMPSKQGMQLMLVAWSVLRDAKPLQWEWESISYRCGDITMGFGRKSILMAVSSTHATWVNEEAQGAPPVIWGRGW